MVWDIDPVAFTITSAGLPIRWYTLFFYGGFLSGFLFILGLWIHEKRKLWLLLPGFVLLLLGMILGARMGEVILYPAVSSQGTFDSYSGGLASHGGFAGVLFAIFLLSLLDKSESFLSLADPMALTLPFAGAFIRVGNFFNSEILGEPTSLPWAVVFPRVDLLPRHPTQVYEALGYTLVGVYLLYVYRQNKHRNRKGQVLALALILMSLVRIFAEMTKVPIGTFHAIDGIKLGQVLSLPFLISGLVLAFFLRTRRLR